MKGFRITLTAIYNDNDLTPDDVSDFVWEAMKSGGHGITMCNVSAITKVRNVNEEIHKIKEVIGKQAGAGEKTAGE